MTPNGDVIQSNVIFFFGGGGVLDHVQKHKWHHWIPGDILHHKQVFVFKIEHFKICDFLHDLDLTL